MKRKPPLIPGLDRILSAREASVLLSITQEELLKFYQGQREISLRNLLKRICRSNPNHHFPIIGERTYTLTGVMEATGKGRSWSLCFLERNGVRTWCLGVHYLYAQADVDNAWRKESIMWEEWIPLIQVSCVYGVDLRTVLLQIARGRIRVRAGHREQLLDLHRDPIWGCGVLFIFVSKSCRNRRTDHASGLFSHPSMSIARILAHNFKTTTEADRKEGANHRLATRQSCL